MPLASVAAVYLDRDGVINAKAPEGEYVTRWEEFAFLPNALAGLQELARLGVPVVVVTNQRGVARGFLTGTELELIHERMLVAIENAGGRVDGIYVCPHEGGCECRKPQTKLFTDAAAEHGFDPAEAVVIGDRRSDLDAGRTLGARLIFVRGFPEDPGPGVAYEAEDLLDAARWLTSASSSA